MTPIATAILFVSFSITLIHVFGIDKGLRIDKVGQCYNKDTFLINMNLTVQNNQHQSVMNGRLKVLEDLPLKYLMDLEFIRCKSKEMLDSCHSYTTIKVNNPCNILKAKNQIWSSYIQSFEPPLKCPTKKGTYILKNGMFNPSLFVTFPMDDWYWKINIKCYTTDRSRMIFAFCIDMIIVKSRT